QAVSGRHLRRRRVRKIALQGATTRHGRTGDLAHAVGLACHNPAISRHRRSQTEGGKFFFAADESVPSRTAHTACAKSRRQSSHMGKFWNAILHTQQAGLWRHSKKAPRTPASLSFMTPKPGATSSDYFPTWPLISPGRLAAV